MPLDSNIQQKPNRFLEKIEAVRARRQAENGGTAGGSPQDFFDRHYDSIFAANPDRDPMVLSEGIRAVHEGGRLPANPPTVDELESLGLTRIKANEPGYPEVIGKGMIRGFEGLAGGVGSAVRWAGDVAGVETATDLGKTASDYWTRARQEGVARPDPFLNRGTFWENPSLKRAAGIVGEAVPSLAAALTAGVATGSPWAGAALLGVAEGAPQYEESRAAGKGVGESSIYGGLSTVGTTLLEFLPVGMILKESGGLVKGALKGMAAEGLQEGTQQLWQNLIAKLGYDETRSLADGLIESMIGGAGAGGIAGGVTGHINQKIERAKAAGATDEDIQAASEDIAQQVDGLAGQIDPGHVKAKENEAFLSSVKAKLMAGNDGEGNLFTDEDVLALQQERPDLVDELNALIIDDMAAQPLTPVSPAVTKRRRPDWPFGVHMTSEMEQGIVEPEVLTAKEAKRRFNAAIAGKPVDETYKGKGFLTSDEQTWLNTMRADLQSGQGPQSIFQEPGIGEGGHGEVTRSPSGNPDWFQRLIADRRVKSKKQVMDVLGKALKGEDLTRGEERILNDLRTFIPEVQSEYERNYSEIIDFFENQAKAGQKESIPDSVRIVDPAQQEEAVLADLRRYSDEQINSMVELFKDTDHAFSDLLTRELARRAEVKVNTASVPAALPSAATETEAEPAVHQQPQTSTPSGQTVDLSPYGLSVNRSQTKNGKPVWEITGEGTKQFRDILKAAGKELTGKNASFYLPKKAWSIYGDTDPSTAIHAAITRIQQGQQQQIQEGAQQQVQGQQQIPQQVQPLSSRSGGEVLESTPAQAVRPESQIQPTKEMEATPKKQPGEETGYFNGDKIAYTGIVTTDGFREFIYLEGAKKGEKGHRMSKEEADANQERVKQEWLSQQEQFRRLHKSEKEIVESPETDIKPSAMLKLTRWVEQNLNNGFSWQQLFSAADESFGGTQAQGVYTPVDAYDAMEVGINRSILQAQHDLNASVEQAVEEIRSLKELVSKIPTQTKRTQEKDELQQFSTPPALAYVAARVANIGKDDIVLEPSAGTGNLVTMAKLAGPKAVVANELSVRRAALLPLVGLDRIFTENAEQLHNILPADVKPSVVLMNPPFSSTAGRLKGKSKNRGTNVTQHLEQALSRLESGGRLVAIVGRGMAEGRPAFESWWQKIKQKYNVLANVGISGKEYQKYGTTFDNQIIVIDKTGKTGDNLITGNVETIEELIPLLEEVRNERQPNRSNDSQKAEAASLGEQPANKQGGQTPSSKSESADRQPANSRPATDRLPFESRQDRDQPRQGNPDTRNSGRNDEPVGTPERGEVSGPSRTRESVESERSRSGGNDNGRTGQQTVGSSKGLPEGESDSLSFEDAAPVESEPGELSDSIYDSYVPKARIANSKPHPTKLVQSAAMAATSLPPANYQPSIQKSIINNGSLSDAQMEPIVYAGQAHKEILPNGQRKGFFVGDGTGVGKGREIAGTILDNWNQGRKKAVWISEKSALFKDAKRDLLGIGWKDGAGKLFDLGKTKLGNRVSAKEGILFTTYDTLRNNHDMVRQDTPSTLQDMRVRVNQIAQWFGSDYDGLIVFDESHNMGNAVAMRGSRGMTKPSGKALAGVLLQDLLPNARVLYVSATGATEVINLSYASRLGLWGEGTPFSDRSKFVSEVSSGGVAAMELVAQNMKTMGVYVARSLSHDDVTHESMEHSLTSEQRQIYNELARAWQVVLHDIDSALGITNANHSAAAKSAILSAFWSTQQRFFNQIITSMQMPSVLKSIHQNIEDGNSAVLQVVNTGEAAQERALTRMTDEDELEDLDLSPKDQLLELVQNAFPVREYEVYTDANDNVRTRPVVDSDGNPVLNAEAVALREDLLMRLGSIRCPANPLDMILQEFGTDMVAEVTGRTKRVVQDKTGKYIQEKWSHSRSTADADAFMNDKKRILVFSDAGGTGRSFHSDKVVKNQRKRIHYLVQPGWRADKAVQGMGRTHRSNEASAPHYILPTTDLNGQKRFISSIARRLDQLGALTKGQRQTGSQGIFQARDNLESEYAREALRLFFRDVSAGSISGLSLESFEKQTGLKLIDEMTGALKKQLPTIQQFLNRLLSMEIDEQNKTFDAFSQRMDAIIQRAADNGTLDVGMETVRGLSITKANDQTVWTDPASGAETHYVQIDVENPASLVDWDQAKKYAQVFMVNKRSGKIWAASRERQRTNSDGAVVSIKTLLSANDSRQDILTETLSDADKWRTVESKEARELWQAEYDALPKTVTSRKHLITGAILPIWDRLVGDAKIIRLQTGSGEKMLGREIRVQDLDHTLENLGVGREYVQRTGSELMQRILNGYKVRLTNGWRIQKRTVSGDDRIEIIGPNISDLPLLQRMGVITERIQWTTRYFVPTGEQGTEILDRVLKGKDILSEEAPYSGPRLEGSDSEIQYGRSVSPGRALTYADLSSVFKGQNITVNDDGSVTVATKAGKFLTINLVERINVNEAAFELAYGQKPEGSKITGSYRRGRIQIRRDSADKWTLQHETTHWLEDSGILSPWDVAILKAKIKELAAKGRFVPVNPKEVGGTEDRANFVAQSLAGQQQAETGALRKIMDKVRAWLDRFVNLFTRTAGGVLRDIESGKIFTRNLNGRKVQTRRAPEYDQVAPQWYSQMARVVAAKLPGKGTGESYWSTIQAWAKKGEFKAEELEWSGLEEWLKEKAGPVTKDEVVEFLNSGGVQVEEVVSTSRSVDRDDVEAWVKNEDRVEFYEDIDEPIGKIRAYFPANERLVEAAQSRIEEAWDNPDSPIWAIIKQTKDDYVWHEETEWGVEEGPGYGTFEDDAKKAVTPSDIFTDEEIDEIFENAWDEYGNSIVQDRYDEEVRESVEEGEPARHQSWIEKGSYDRYTELLFVLPEGSFWEGSHWKTTGVVAHARFTERENVKGKKTLFVEEIQSDWHQEGRKKGYKKGLKSENYATWASKRGMTPQEVESTWQTDDPRFLDWKKAEEEAYQDNTRIPNAPFKTTWPLLAMKRMIRWAAEKGFDTVAWTTGEQQAERYDLSKQVDVIDGYNFHDGTYKVVATRNGENLINKRVEGENALEELIGKEFAKKIISQEIQMESYYGPDLKVGGEGMKGFYDKILPAATDKFIKKWGAKVGTTEMGFGSQGVRQVHSFDITPAMRQAALHEGMPLFATSEPKGMPTIYKPFGVGKFIGGRVYLHRSAFDVLPASVQKAINKAEVPFDWTIIKYDPKSKDVSLIESRDFDSADEPTVGRSYIIKTGEVLSPPPDPWIYHHKWTMVRPEYTGFNVSESRERSRDWLSLDEKINKILIGKKSYWQTHVVPKIVKQKIDTSGTSLAQVAAVFKSPIFRPGKVNIDIGGGKYDLGTKYLKDNFGTKNIIIDPFSRDVDFNRSAMSLVLAGQKGETVTVNNVLNTIKEKSARLNVILQAAKALAPGGIAYFQIYEGVKGRSSSPTRAGWQNNKKTAFYLPEIQEYFTDAIIKNSNVIVARNPKNTDYVAAWDTGPAGEGRVYFSTSENRAKSGIVDAISKPGRVQTELKTSLAAIRDTLKESSSGPTQWGFFSNLLKTMEWTDDQVGQEIFDATQHREDRKHQIFHHLDHDAADGSQVSQTLKDMKRAPGLTGPLSRIKGTALFDKTDPRLSDEYRQVWAAIDHCDTNEVKWFDSADGKTKGYRSALQEQGVSESVLQTVDKFRNAMDKALDLMRLNLQEVIAAYEAAGKSLPVIFTEKDDTGKTRKYTLKNAYDSMGRFDGMYAPRIRESGDWAILSQDMNGNFYRYHKPSRRAAYALAEELKQQGHTSIKTERVERLPESIYQDLSIGAVSAALEHSISQLKADVDPDVLAKFRVDLIESAADMLKARAFRSHRIARSSRKGRIVKGYIEDPLARHLLYTHRIAGGIAKGEAAERMYTALLGEYREFTREGDSWVLKDDLGNIIESRKISEKDIEKDIQQKTFKVGGLDPAKDGNRYDTYKKYIAEQLRNSDRYDRAIGLGKSIVSFKYLGLNPRSALVNVTAMVTTVPSAIHEYALKGKKEISMPQIGKALALAGRDYVTVMRGEKLENAEEQAFMKDIQVSGYDNPQLTRDAMSEVQSAYGQTWSKIMNGAMWLFSKTEQWNRGSTMLAAYRLARKQGQAHEQAAKSAKLASDRAHGIYGKATLPMWAQGQNATARIAQLGYTYSKFSHNYLQMLFDLGLKKRNIKALTFALVSPAVIGGAASSFGVTVLMGIAKSIMRLLGDDRDPEKMVYDTIREELGDTAEYAARFGVLGLAGVDISGSLSIGLELPKSLIDLTGPFGGVAEDLSEARHYAFDVGKPMQAIESILPNAIANPFIAFRELHGATTRNGYRVWDENGKPYIPGAGETAAKIAGFRSSRRATLSARKWESTKELTKFNERKNSIYEEYRDYLIGPKDAERFQAIMDKISAFNEDVRSAGRDGVVPLITRQSMRRQVKNMSKPSKKQRGLLR